MALWFKQNNLCCLCLPAWSIISHLTLKHLIEAKQNGRTLTLINLFTFLCPFINVALSCMWISATAY